MREITLFLPEEAARAVVEKFENFPTTAALSMTACTSPRGQQRIDVIIPDVSFNEAMALIYATTGTEDGVVTSSQLQSVRGAERILRAVGHAEYEAIAWEEVVQSLERDSFPGPAFMLFIALGSICLLYTSPSPRDKRQSRMPSSA